MKVTRLVFEVTPGSMERLQALKLKTEASSYSEVIRNALRLYEVLVDTIERGGSVILSDTDQPYDDSARTGIFGRRVKW